MLLVKKSLLFLLLFAVFQTRAAVPGIYNIKDYGAVGDGKTDNAVAIQQAIDACSAAKGGIVVIPSGGVFMTGPFELRSDVEFNVQTGATVLANPDESVYKKSAFRANPGEGTIWIGGNNVHHLTLSGAGTIDGNGISFMGAELEDSYVLKPFNVTDPRPHVLTLTGGSHIRIKDLTVKNSAYWTLHLIGCDDVVISGITLLNSLKVRNSDGIDIDHSRNVRISDCYIESGDDCICLKNRREFAEFGPCKNITVSNCTMTSRSCAIKIGSENVDSISNVIVSNCIITKSNRGIGIQNRDEGTVSNVLFSNIIIEGHFFSDVWWGKSEPIYVTSYKRAKSADKDGGWRFARGQREGKAGAVSNIRFSNITCTSENGIYVGGETPGLVSDISFDQINMVLNKTTAIAGGIYDRRPSAVQGLVKAATSAFYFDRASRISITNSNVQWGSNKAPYFAHVVEAREVDDLKIRNLEGTAAFPDKLQPVKKN